MDFKNVKFFFRMELKIDLKVSSKKKLFIFAIYENYLSEMFQVRYLLYYVKKLLFRENEAKMCDYEPSNLKKFMLPTPVLLEIVTNKFLVP